MDRRLITALAVTITLALAGLVVVQAQWIRNSITLKDAQFGESLDHALVAVSERLERLDALDGIRAYDEARKLMEAWAAQPEVDQDLVVPPWADGTAGPVDGWEDSVGAEVGPEDHERMLSELFQGIVGARRYRDIGERLDPKLLDSLILDELMRRGVTGAAEYGVFDATGEARLLQVLAPEDGPTVQRSEHRVRLFRNDIIGEPYWLHLHVSGQQRFVLKSLWPMLAASALFVLMIGSAFVFTLRTIWRQKRLSEIRTDLVNNLTHELKTPISTIALACEALNDPSISRTPEQIKQFTGMIRDENKRLGMLVESVLQSAVVDGGRMKLRVVDVDLHALLAEVVRTSGIQAENRGGSITLVKGAELAHVQGDRIHLTNVFYNLIDNAVKYCEREPVVVLSTTSDATSITVRVKDNGIGIARTEHDKVFERLYRVPTGNLHNVKGFGLGLSYVKAVVERHRGSIRLESEPGLGSTFVITIPFEHGEQDQIVAVRG